MPRSQHRRPDDADADDDAYQDDSYDSATEDDDIDLRRCTECGREVVADSIACPSCGRYLTADESAFGNGRPWWIVAGVVICLLIVLSWYVSMM